MDIVKVSIKNDKIILETSFGDIMIQDVGTQGLIIATDQALNVDIKAFGNTCFIDLKKKAPADGT